VTGVNQDWFFVRAVSICSVAAAATDCLANQINHICRQYEADVLYTLPLVSHVAANVAVNPRSFDHVFHTLDESMLYDIHHAYHAVVSPQFR